jgi:hypothetical protein
LPSNVREELLLKIGNNKKASTNTASIVSSHFDKLPANVREELLLKVSDNLLISEYVPYGVADTVAKNYENLSENVRQELLLKLAESNTAGKICYTVAKNFVKS